MPPKRELTRRITEAVHPFLEKKETISRSADVLKGPKTLLASMLTPIGYFALERPRYVALTNRRLLVVIPPARRGGEPRLEAAFPREDVTVERFDQGPVWARLVLRTPGGRLGLNFARVWRDEAAFLTRKLGGD
jgi:hypothetical protein